jgi:hypothetical protein
MKKFRKHDKNDIVVSIRFDVVTLLLHEVEVVPLLLIFLGSLNETNGLKVFFYSSFIFSQYVDNGFMLFLGS